MDRYLPLRILACMLACAVVLTACDADGDTQAEEVPQDEVAALASEAAEALDEAAAASAEQLSEAAEVVSEAAAGGDLGLSTPGVVAVGTNADFLPFVGYGDSDELTGFDIELFNALARRIGVSPTYTDMPFPNLTGALTAGEIDVAIGAISITDEREEVIDFTRPYFVTSQSLSVPAGSAIESVEDLDSDTVVAVLADTTGEEHALETFATAVVTAYADRASAFAALEAGDVDAVFMDTDAVAEEARTGELELVLQVPTDEAYGIALPEGNAAMRTALNTALGELLEDGTYRELYTRWFTARDVEQALSVLR